MQVLNVVSWLYSDISTFFLVLQIADSSWAGRAPFSRNTQSEPTLKYTQVCSDASVVQSCADITP